MELTVDWRNNYIDKFEKLTPFSNPPRGQKSKYVFMSNPARCRRWTHGPVRRHSIFSGLALKSQKHPQWDTSMGEGDAMERGVEGAIFRGGGGQCKRGRSSSPLMSSVTLGCDCWNSGGMFVIVGHSFLPLKFLPWDITNVFGPTSRWNVLSYAICIRERTFLSNLGLVIPPVSLWLQYLCHQ